MVGGTSKKGTGRRSRLLVRKSSHGRFSRTSGQVGGPPARGLAAVGAGSSPASADAPAPFPLEESKLSIGENVRKRHLDVVYSQCDGFGLHFRVSLRKSISYFNPSAEAIAKENAKVPRPLPRPKLHIRMGKTGNSVTFITPPQLRLSR